MTKTLALGVGLWYSHSAAKASPACRIKAQIVYVYATDLPHDIG